VGGYFFVEAQALLYKAKVFFHEAGCQIGVFLGHGFHDGVVFMG
jgi:hypothetical protein